MPVYIQNKRSLTNDDRKIVREWLHLYLKNPSYPVRGKSLERTRRWANGESQVSIAKSEGVHSVSVSQSVRLLALRVMEFAEGIAK